MQTLHTLALLGIFSLTSCAEFRSYDRPVVRDSVRPLTSQAPVASTDSAQPGFVRSSRAPLIYDVRDLTFAPKAQPAPELILRGSREADFRDIFESDEGSPVVADLDGLIDIIQSRVGDDYEVTPLGDGHIVVKPLRR